MEDNGPESFAQLTDRLLPAPISHATWCPTMDLLAAAFTDGRIAMHRLNWQRLWLVTPDAPATALAWTPSGNALAVGRADGVVSLLDAETGDVVDETRFDSSGGVPNLAMALHCDVVGAPVTAIAWRFAGLITNTHIDKIQSFRAAGAVAALTWVEEDDTAAVGVALPQQALQGRARRVCPPPPATTSCKSTTQVLAQICVLVQRRCSQYPTQPVTVTRQIQLNAAMIGPCGSVCGLRALLVVQGGSAEAKAAWPPLPSKLTLLGIAYESGSIRICSAALLELMHLSPGQLAKLGLSAGGAAADPPGSASQVQCITCLTPN